MSNRIILIDRDAVRRGQIRGAFGKHDLDVIEFESGKDAIKHLLFNSINAVVLDYGSSYEPGNPMPSGKRIVEEIGNIDAFVPLVLVCDRCDTLDHETSAAADLVIRRPMAARQLMDGVLTVMGETLRERVQRKSGYIFAFR